MSIYLPFYKNFVEVSASLHNKTYVLMLKDLENMVLIMLGKIFVLHTYVLCVSFHDVLVLYKMLIVLSFALYIFLIMSKCYYFSIKYYIFADPSNIDAFTYQTRNRRINNLP